MTTRCPFWPIDLIWAHHLPEMLIGIQSHRNQEHSPMLRILIIDPNTFFRESLGKIIIDRFSGIEIQEATDGAKGLNRLKTFAPQLIFIDIYLPDRSGLDLAIEIKTAYPEIILAIFTRYDSPEYQAAANDSGIEHLIPKDDWTSKDILQLVEAVSEQFRY
jgi:DNA-binding NarL/FixJ family response regulator